MSAVTDPPAKAVNRYLITWEKTVQRFRDECQFDPLVEFEGMQIDEIVPGVFATQSQRFKVFKQRADRMRDAVIKLLEIIRRMSDVLEAKLFRESEELFKPQRVVVCVLAPLLRAGGDNGAKYEAIIGLIEHLAKTLSYLPSELNTMTAALDQALIQILIEFVSTVGCSLQSLRRKSSKRILKGYLTEDTSITKHFRTIEMLIKDVQWSQNPFPLLFKLEWRKAMDAYKQNARVDPTSSTWPDTDTPEKVLAFVNSSDAVFKRGDMERSRLRMLLKGILDRIQVMVDALPEDLRTDCGIANIAFGSMSALIMACKEKKAAFEVVENTLRAAESRLPRLTADEYRRDNLNATVARVLIQTITLIGLTAKLLRDNKSFLAAISAINIAERRSSQNVALTLALDDLANLSRTIPDKLTSIISPRAQIWEQAVEKYIATTKGDYLTVQSLDTIQSLEELKQDIDMRRIEFTRDREVNGEFRELMKPIFRCLGVLLGSVADGISIMFRPAKVISGAMGLLFEAANRVGTINENIVELFEQISGYLDRVAVHGSREISPGLLVIYVQILAQFLIILGLVTRAINDGQFVRFLNFTMGGVDEVQLALKKLSGLLDSEQRMAVTLAASANPGPHSGLSAAKLEAHVPPHVIPPPPLCIGRETEKTEIIEFILACKSAVILGSGGVGKTTVALAVMHESRIADRFSARYFIDCDGVTTLALLLGRIADVLRIPASSRDQYLTDRLFDALHGKNIVMCLDNFESLWETDSKVTIESWLKSLIALVGLVVLVTMRGAERPSGVMHYRVLSPPDFKHALEIFNEISGCADVFAQQLVSAVDCHPLAVSLLAHQISPETETTESLWKRWEKRGTAVASRSDTERHRLLNLECSIELSLESPRVKADPTARIVLAILALLPDGLASPSPIAQELESCSPNLADLSSALATLTRSALAYIGKSGPGRFRVLSPIGQYVRARHSAFIRADVLDACVQVYAGFINERHDCSDPQMHNDVPMELINIHSILEHALDCALSQQNNVSISIMVAVRRQAKWAMYWGTPSADLLLRVQLLAYTPLEELGNCLKCLGQVYCHLDLLEEAESSLLEAAELYQQTRDVPGEGSGRCELGALYVRLDRLEDAESSLLRALDLYQQTHDRKALHETGSSGRSRVIPAGGAGLVPASQQVWSRSHHLRTWKLYIRLDRLEDAESFLVQARDFYQQIHHTLGEGNGRRELGTLYIRMNRLEDAETSLMRAVELYQQIHHPLGEANGRCELGRLYMQLDRLGEAETSLLRSMELYRQAHYKLNEGNSWLNLGMLYMRLDRLEEAETLLLQALDLYQQIHHTVGEGSVRLKLGKFYMRLNRLEKAELALLRAVELFQHARDVLGEGNGRCELGRLYMRLDRSEEAETSLLRAVELYQQALCKLNEGSGRLELGMFYMRLNRLVEAESSLLEAVELYQRAHEKIGEGNARCGLGTLYMRLDRLDEAESPLLEAVELHQQAHEKIGEGNGIVELGKLYIRLGRLEEAESSLLRAVELYQQTQTKLGEASGRHELGTLYMRLNRLEEAESSLLQAVELYQQTQSKLGEGHSMRELGTLCMRLDRLAEAESSLLRAVELYQQTQTKLGEGLGMRELGTLYMRLNRLAEAESSLLRAVELYQQTQTKPGEASGRHELGTLYMRLNRLEEAESSLLQAVELYQQTQSKFSESCCRCELGTLYMRLNRLEEAQSLLLQAVELYQQIHSKIGEADSRQELGTLYMRLDRLDEAESSLLRAVELSQQSYNRLGEGNSRCELGTLYMRLDRLDEAESSLLRAVELFKQIDDRYSEGGGTLQLGTLYMRLDRLEKAESSLLRAVELYQQVHDKLGEGNGRLELGKLYMRLDRLEEAESLLPRAVELYQLAHSAWGEGNGRSQLGALYTRLDRLDKVEPLLLRAAELHQKAHVTDEEGYDRRRVGELYMRQDRLEEAETSLLHAVELHQRSRDGFGEGDDRSCLGELFMRRDRLNEAETSLLAAVELHQRASSTIGEGDDRLRLGKLYLRQARLSDAEVEVELAIVLYERSQSRSGCESARTLLADIRQKMAQENEPSPAEACA